MIEVTPSPSPPAIALRASPSSPAAEPRRVAPPAHVRLSEPTPPTTPPDLSGTVLRERYELVRRIGYGGMGEVYEARFLASGQRVAVKLLFQRLADSPEMLTRFRHELQALESVKHPAIVSVRDYDFTDDRRPFLVMEFLEGADLSRRRRRPLAEVVTIGIQVCEALDILHARGIIHRDLTRRNIIAVGEGRDVKVKVIDFGVSKLSAAHYAEARPYMTPPEQRLRTRTGLFFGTPGYMAPEATDEPPCPRQDVYSLGVVLFELLVGRQPPLAWLTEIPGDVDHAALGLDALTWRVLLKAIEPDPAVRHQSATTLKDALKDLMLNISDDENEAPAPPPRREGPAPAPAITEARANADTRVLPASRPGRWPWIAVIVLGLYVVVDLGMHVLAEETPPAGRSAHTQAAREQDEADDGTRSEREALPPPDEPQPRQPPSAPTLTTAEESLPPAISGAESTDEGAPTTSTTPAVSAPKTSRSRAAVRQRVSTRRAELDECLRGSPALTARLVIRPDGRVDHLDLDGASPMVELCVRDVLEPLVFPAADRRTTHRLPLGGP